MGAGIRNCPAGVIGSDSALGTAIFLLLPLREKGLATFFPGADSGGEIKCHFLPLKMPLKKR